MQQQQQQQQQQRQAAILMAQRQQRQASLSAPQNAANPTVTGPVGALRQQIGAAQARMQVGLAPVNTGQPSVQLPHSNVAQASGQAALAMQQQFLQHAQLAAAVRLHQQNQIIQQSQQVAKKQENTASASTPSAASRVTAPVNNNVGAAQAPSEPCAAAISRGKVSAGLQQQRLMVEQAPGSVGLTLQRQQQQQALSQQLEFSVGIRAQMQQLQQQQGEKAAQIQTQKLGASPSGSIPQRNHHQQQQVPSIGTPSPSLLPRQQQDQKQQHQALKVMQAPIKQAQAVQKPLHQHQQHDFQTKESEAIKATTVATSTALNQQQGQQATLQKAKQAVLQAQLQKARSPGTEEEKQKQKSVGLPAEEGLKQLPSSQNKDTSQASISPSNAQENILVAASHPGTVSPRQKSLGFLVNVQKWDEVLKRIQHDPSDFMIRENASVLHGAMVKSAWHVVKDLLALVPALANKPCVVLSSQPPLPPIHMALSFSAPPETEKQAFSVYLDAIHRIAAGNIQSLGMRDAEGYTPLHSSIVSKHPARVSLVLLNAFPKAAKIVDAAGYLPFHTFLTRICKSSKNVTKADCQLMNLLLNICPECISSTVPAKKMDGTVLPGKSESAEIILKKYSQTMTRHNYAAAERLLSCHKAQFLSLQQAQRGAARLEQGSVVAEVDKAPAPAKLSTQQEQNLERKRRSRDLLQQQYDKMKKVAMEQIEEMQRQGVDIRKAIQSVKDPEASSRTESMSAVQVATDESRATQYNKLLKEREDLNKLLSKKNESGKQMFEVLTKSREALIKERRENYRKQVTGVIKKHKEDIIHLRDCAEKKKKDLEKRSAQLKQGRSKIALLQKQCNDVENDVKQRRDALEALQLSKKRKMQVLLTRHSEEMMREKKAFFGEMGHLYDELEEKRQCEQECPGAKGIEGFSLSSRNENDDPACRLIMQLREDISSLEETVDHLLKRQSQSEEGTKFKLSDDVDALDEDEDEDINVVDSDDDSSQPFQAAEDDLENEFGIYERE